jgi:hypothetical protein
LNQQADLVSFIVHVDDDLLDQHANQLLLQAARGTRVIPQPPYRRSSLNWSRWFTV